MLDTLRKVETPEGVELALRLAGPLPRAAAWLIDGFTRLLVFIILASVLAVLGMIGVGVLLLATFSLMWLYWVLFEVLWNGATPGKRIMKLRVVHQDGTPVTWGSSIVRNTVRFVDSLPMFYGIGFIACLLDQESRRLGDLAAGTVVIHEADPDMRLPDDIEWLAPEAPAVTLMPAERRAIVGYAERYATLTAGRSTELAGMVEGALARGPMTPERLRRISSWLAGRS